MSIGPKFELRTFVWGKPKKHNLSAGDSTVTEFQHVNNLPGTRPRQAQKIHRLEDTSTFVVSFDDGSLHLISIKLENDISSFEDAAIITEDSPTNCVSLMSSVKRDDPDGGQSIYFFNTRYNCLEKLAFKVVHEIGEVQNQKSVVYKPESQRLFTTTDMPVMSLRWERSYLNPNSYSFLGPRI